MDFSLCLCTLDVDICVGSLERTTVGAIFVDSHAYGMLHIYKKNYA